MSHRKATQEVAALEKALAASPSTTAAALEPLLATLKEAVAIFGDGESTNNDNDDDDIVASLVASVAAHLVPVAAALTKAGAAGAVGTAGAGFVKVEGGGGVKTEGVTAAGAGAAGVAGTPGASSTGPSYDKDAVVCSTASPISFVSPRGKAHTHDSFLLAKHTHSAC